MSKIETWNLNDMFGIEENDDSSKEVEIEDNIEQNKIEIKLIDLIPFRNHPFKLYEGKRLEEMVESIKEYGIITPLIVRPLEDGKYEILSGHNRANAGKLAGLEKAPVVIKEDLTDEEAMLIVTETNLQQRSLEELSHSEKARIFTERHEAIKNQGKRMDIINEIETISNTDNFNEISNLSPGGTRKLAEEYRLGKSTIARYLRIDKLNNELKEKVDNGDIPVKAGVDISYLNEENQNILNTLVDENNYKVDLKKSSEIKKLNKARNLNYNKMNDILSGEYFKKPKPKKTPKLSASFNKKIMEKFESKNMNIKDIENLLLQLLDEYIGVEKDIKNG